MNNINKGFKYLSEYQESLSTDKGVIGVDVSDILDIKSGWCNHLHKTGTHRPRSREQVWKFYSEGGGTSVCRVTATVRCYYISILIVLG